jgi:hypothetical protein
MITKHTPGPWLREGCFVYALHIWRGRAVNRFSAAISGYTSQGGTEDEALANARLIEASPDLLDSFEISLARAYAAGHQRGHEDTVEGIFTEVWREDTSTYFAADIREMMADGSLPEAQTAIAKATGKEIA